LEAETLNVLVLYGTRWGGTEKVAQTIGKALQDEGHAVEVVDAKEAPQSIDAYDLILVGSGLRADKWTKESEAFVAKNASAFKAKKLALYVAALWLTAKTRLQRRQETYLDDFAAKYGLAPIALGYFGGLMDFSYSHGLLVDIIVRVNRRNLRKNGLDTASVHDTRDWAAIEAWGHEVAKIAQSTT
jgi:menaquinone-dependent protoporphyrinogen oxidase